MGCLEMISIKLWILYRPQIYRLHRVVCMIVCNSIHRNLLLRLKTKNGTRFIPLDGGALDAAIMIVAKVKNKVLFPRYIIQNKGKVNNDVASNSLNKRLCTIIDERKTMHSFQHTMQTRLRYVKCP
jgi:hypothetical protein